MAEKIPPHSINAEKSVLGAAMLNENALADVTEILKPEDFYNSAHKEIYRVMKAMAEDDKKVDIVTVADELERQGVLEAAGGRAYIAELPNQAPLFSHAKDYAEIVERKAILRSLIKASEDIEAECYEEEKEGREILDRAEQRIFDISEKKVKGDYVPLEKVIKKNLELIDIAVKAEGKITGVPTGFTKLDEITGGLQKSDLIVLAARPAMGKSAFALNLALNASRKADAGVLIFNLEMADTQLGLRLLSMMSSVEIQNIQRGKLTSEEWGYLTTAMDQLSNTKISIDDTPGNTLLEMRNKCRRYKKKVGLDLVIVDYLQRMDLEGSSENRQNEIAKLSRGFKLMARELDCPVVLLSQLNRDVERRNDKRPMTADLRDSGAIEQDADIIMFLYRDEVYNDSTDKPGICEIDIAKHRNGPTGKVEVSFVSKYTRFVDIAYGEDI